MRHHGGAQSQIVENVVSRTYDRYLSPRQQLGLLSRARWRNLTYREDSLHKQDKFRYYCTGGNQSSVPFGSRRQQLNQECGRVRPHHYGWFTTSFRLQSQLHKKGSSAWPLWIQQHCVDSKWNLHSFANRHYMQQLSFCWIIWFLRRLRRNSCRSGQWLILHQVNGVIIDVPSCGGFPLCSRGLCGEADG